MIGVLVALCCLIGASPAEKLHEKMTPDELQEIFHTTDNGNLIINHHKIQSINKIIL